MSAARSSYNNHPIPANGQRIEFRNGQFIIPDRPIIPFVEGDGTGRDIWKASRRVFDAAVEKAYGGKREVAWYEVYAGEKAFEMFKEWMPQDTVDNPVICNKGDNAHAGAAGAKEGIALEGCCFILHLPQGYCHWCRWSWARVCLRRCR